MRYNHKMMMTKPTEPICFMCSKKVPKAMATECDKLNRHRSKDELPYQPICAECEKALVEEYAGGS